MGAAFESGFRIARVPRSGMEFARGGLASFRNSDVDMIETSDSKLYTRHRIPGRDSFQS
jgi:hypothetical protein